ncbi:MAG TPA: transporter [Chthoniobacterales bacterium]
MAYFDVRRLLNPISRARMRILSWSLRLLSGLVLLAVIPAQAQNRGVYPLGMSTLNSGITPEPGFAYSNQFLFYSRNEAKDDNGNTLPVSGNNYVLMDMNTVTWASKETLLAGARYSASATLPFAKNDLTSDIQGNISGGSGFADSYYLPLILGWSWDRVAVKAMYGFLAPTGRFDANANDNVGSGYWTHTLSSGQTYYLTKDKFLIFSAFEMYEFHTTQQGTGIHPGDTFDLDYSLMRTVLNKTALRLQIGLAGYEARQLTAKTGPGITSAMSDERYAVNAMGVAVNLALPKQRTNVTLRFFDEFADRATFQGYSFQVAGAISF